jgi:cation transport ATPase
MQSSLEAGDAFLTPEAFTADAFYDARGVSRRFAAAAGARRAAVRSYRFLDDHPLRPVLARRAFVYDLALAMIVHTLADRAQEARAIGYTLCQRRSGNAASESGQIGARLGLCGAFMLNAMGFTLPSYLGMPDDFAFSGLFQLIGLLTATLSMLVGGSYFISRAWSAARMGILHIDLPIALGLCIAFTGSMLGWALKVPGLLYFDFVCTFVFLMLGGRYLQLSAMEKNRQRLQRHRPVPEMMRAHAGKHRRAAACVK